MSRAIGPWAAALVLAFASAPVAVPVARAARLSGACPEAIPLAEPIARASSRFAIPGALIRAVIAAESNFAVFAVSPKGAMGLMQLMPGTWAELRLRYALGGDPFDPCDNIIAGTAYLRELLDRYGDPGFLAAYNAGPGRYEAYLRGARPLPVETVTYVARLSSATLGAPSATLPRGSDADDWRAGALFPGTANSSADPAPNAAREVRGPPAIKADAPVSGPQPDRIFVPRTGTPE